MTNFNTYPLKNGYETRIFNCQFKITEKIEQRDFKSLMNKLQLHKRYILEISYSRIFNSYYLTVCRRKNYKLHREVIARVKFNNWNLDIEMVKSILHDQVELVNIENKGKLLSLLQSIIDSKTQAEKMNKKSAIRVLRMKQTNEIYYCERRKCLKPNSRCTNEVILSLFPRFMLPSTIEPKTESEVQILEQVLQERQTIKNQIDAQQEQEFEEEKSTFNELMLKQMQMRAKALHHVDDSDSESNEDDEDSSSGGRGRRRRRHRISSNSSSS